MVTYNNLTLVNIKELDNTSILAAGEFFEWVFIFFIFYIYINLCFWFFF